MIHTWSICPANSAVSSRRSAELKSGVRWCAPSGGSLDTHTNITRMVLYCWQKMEAETLGVVKISLDMVLDTFRKTKQLVGKGEHCCAEWTALIIMLCYYCVESSTERKRNGEREREMESERKRNRDRHSQHMHEREKHPTSFACWAQCWFGSLSGLFWAGMENQVFLPMITTFCLPGRRNFP